jgi:Tfp pilus assembly protein PilO
MIGGSLSRRERTLIGLAIVVLVVVGGWEFIIDPIRERNRAAEDLVPAREQLFAQRRDLVARKEQIAAELGALNARLETLSTRFLTAATPAVAASELQKMAKDMAAQAGTEIRSERILTPVERGELLEIPIEVAVSGEIRQLVDLLTRLEGAPKLLTVQDLKVRVVNVSQPRDLLATLTLSGYILGAKAKA